MRQRWYGMLVACLCCILVGTGLAMIYGRTQVIYWIVFGGNTDPGDGNCGGGAKDQLVAGGWASADEICQVQWKADISSGTNQEVDEAMPAGKDAIARFCDDPAGAGCVYAGFSLGSMPALQLAAETGHSPDGVYIYGAPQPSPGIWHSDAVDEPVAEPFIEVVGKLDPDRLAPAGTHNYFDTRDPYNNFAPQCTGPGMFAVSLDGHRIITRQEADNSHQWVGTDGVLEFEANYTGPIGLPASGSDPSMPWANCPFGDWHNTSLTPGPATNPDNPFQVPTIPGVTPGGPIEQPQFPSAPALPPLPATP